MSYKINKLRKALNKLHTKCPDLHGIEVYPWDDGKIYIYPNDVEFELFTYLAHRFKGVKHD